jgi:hypothetical protein
VSVQAEAIAYGVHVVDELLKFNSTGEQIIQALQLKGWGPGRMADALLADESLWAAQPSECAAEGEHRGPLITEFPDGSGRLLCRAHWGSTPSIPVVDKEALAKAYDPDAFDDAVKKSTHPVAQVQWAARRKLATEAADRAFASGLFRDAADVWDEAKQAVREEVRRLPAWGGLNPGDRGGFDMDEHLEENPRIQVLAAIDATPCPYRSAS